MRPAGPSLGGFILNVYKEIPWTSHDAVARVRRILETRQVGHAGSLDPFASGVLVVAVGRATRLVGYLMDQPKEYRGTMLLGRRTTSGDLGGQVVEERSVPVLDLDSLRREASEFVGETMQVPPMVSALKHRGQRLYDLARKGIEVERTPRRVRIDRFEVTHVEPPRVDFELGCGRGTYVRTLVEDFAARIGTVAMVEALTRTRVGPFSVADSSRLISAPGNTRAGLTAQAVSMAAAVPHLVEGRVSDRWAQRLRHGGAPPLRGITFGEPPTPGAAIRLVGGDGDLLAVGRLEWLPGPADRPIEDSCCLRLERVF
jgi:tRNA pseudouridine55 synthase